MTLTTFGCDPDLDPPPFPMNGFTHYRENEQPLELSKEMLELSNEAVRKAFSHPKNHRKDYTMYRIEISISNAKTEQKEFLEKLLGLFLDVLVLAGFKTQGAVISGEKEN